MNSKLSLHPSRLALTAGLMLCTVALASANSLVTFQVNMSNSVANATFDPNIWTMAVRGTFNGWTAYPLTNNPNGPDTNLWTGTFLVTSNVYSGATVSPNGTVMSYKYTVEPNGTYETVFLGGGHNRLLTLPGNNGGSVTTPMAFYGDPLQVTNTVTFQVDLAQQINVGKFIPGTSTNQARGIFNGWGGSAIAATNDPTILRTNQNGLVTSNVYVSTYEIVGSPGMTLDYKYFIDTGANWDAPAAGAGDPADNNNRFFSFGPPSQKTPIVFFNDAPYAPIATNDITFQVDMSAQILNGNYNRSNGDIVELRGNFNSWGGTPIALTNDPSAPNTNIYKVVYRIVDGVGAVEQYKFWATNDVNGGWETMADNRTMRIISGTSQVLPVVFFSNVDPSDLLPADTVVTFSVNMTNAVGTDSHPFNPLADMVFINGVPNGSFGAWNGLLPQLTNNPVGSELYSLDILVPKGSPVMQTYKYGINGVDDEGPAGANHVRYIRATATGSYVMPLDVFTPTPPTEPSFGNLTASQGAAGHAAISWLGRPGVHLQSAASLNPPVVWQDHPETDGANWTGGGTASPNGFVTVTNTPTANGKSFFRIIKQ